MNIITGLNDNWLSLKSSEVDCDITHTIRGLKNESEIINYKQFGNQPYSYVNFQCRTVGCKYKFLYDPYTYFNNPILKCPKCSGYNVTSEWIQYTSPIAQEYTIFHPEIVNYVEFQSLYNTITDSDELSSKYCAENIFNTNKYGWISANTGAPHSIIWESEYPNEICKLQLIPRPTYMTSPAATELPTMFKFYGSIDSTSWDLLLDITDSPSESVLYDIENSNQYYYYKLSNFVGTIQIVYESFSSDYNTIEVSDMLENIQNNDIKNVFDDEDDSSGWIGERHLLLDHYIKWSTLVPRALKKIELQVLDQNVPNKYLYCPPSYGVFGSIDDINYKLILRVTGDPLTGGVEHELNNDIYYTYFKIMQFGNDDKYDQSINTVIIPNNISASNSYICQFYNIIEKSTECNQEYMVPISKSPNYLLSDDSNSWTSILSKDDNQIVVDFGELLNIKRFKISTDISSFSNRGNNLKAAEKSDINSSGCPSSFDIYGSQDTTSWNLLKQISGILNTGTSDYIELDNSDLYQYYKICNFIGIEDSRDFSKLANSITASSYYSSTIGVTSKYSPESVISDALGCMWKPNINDYDPWLKFYFTNLYIIKGFKIVSNNSSTTLPNIRLYGSVDDSVYDILYEGSYDVNKTISLNNTEAYLYYKISFITTDDTDAPSIYRLMLFDNSTEFLRSTISYIEFANDSILEAHPAIGVINMSGKTQVSDSVSIYKMKFFKKVITPSYNEVVIDPVMKKDQFYGKIYHQHYQRVSS